MERPRKIIHIDMDAFYASVEQLDHPHLRGRPVVVGGEPRGRGVVAAASYEARKFGIRSAMSSAKAHRLCPQAVFMPPNFSRYLEVSEQVMAVLREVTPLVEPLSLDEAYLDVTENALGEALAGKIALHLKQRIHERVGLTASAGVGPNKLVAKIASELRKPNGLVVIPPHRVRAFLEKLPVERIWGVGPATAERLRALGLRTAGDIAAAPASELEQTFGKFGLFLHELSSGVDERAVDPNREPKSRGTETTFTSDILNREELVRVIRGQAEEVAASLQELGKPGRTVTLKVKYADFQVATRSHTIPRPTWDAERIHKTATKLLLETTEAGERPIRLTGVSVSGFEHEGQPQQLWFDLE